MRDLDAFVDMATDGPYPAEGLTMTAVPTLDAPGARLCYYRTGAGPAVLMIQGVGLVGNGWRPQVDGLSDRFDIVTFDNRGTGGSSRFDGALSIEAMADDALAIMDAERIRKFHVVGHSMGGIIAQQLALNAPDRVASLALVCTFDRGRHGSAMSPSLLFTAIRMRVGARRMRRNAFLGLVMPSGYLATVDRGRLTETLAPLFGHDLADQPAIVMQQVRAMSRHDVFVRLGELGGIRTLVLSAAEDRIARPKYGRALAAAIPGARYVELTDAGHGVTIQRATDVNALLAAHFDDAERSPVDRAS
jgi:aminoacrylate hydrolase